MRPYSGNKLREQMTRALLVSLKMYSPRKVFYAIATRRGALHLSQRVDP
jgi:hypothetical protein